MKVHRETIIYVVKNTILGMARISSTGGFDGRKLAWAPNNDAGFFQTMLMHEHGPDAETSLCLTDA